MRILIRSSKKTRDQLLRGVSGAGFLHDLPAEFRVCFSITFTSGNQNNFPAAPSIPLDFSNTMLSSWLQSFSVFELKSVQQWNNGARARSAKTAGGRRTCSEGRPDRPCRSSSEVTGSLTNVSSPFPVILSLNFAVCRACLACRSPQKPDLITSFSSQIFCSIFQIPLPFFH